jgi:hypothetical protein
MQVVASGQGARLRVPGVAVGLAIHRLGDREHEQAGGVRVHQRLAHVVLDRRVVGDPQAHVDVLLAGGVPLGDVDRSEREPVPHGGGPDQEPGVDRLVVRVRAVALGPDRWVAGISTFGTSRGPDWFPRRPSASQSDGLGLHLVAVDHEHGQVVVPGEVGARRLDDVEVGEPRRGRPRRLLADLVAAVRALGAEETGYQKCEPVSGSEYESVPILPELSGRMYLSTSSGVWRSMIAFTAPMCIT